MAIGVNITRDIQYRIKIENGFLAKQNFRKYEASKIAVVTDPKIRSLHGEKLENLLRNQDFVVIELPRGEKGKTQKQAEKILSKLAKQEFDRDSMIVAFGGGSVGDTAGFAASRYMRGIRLIQVPTTLLAMVDSSIGGKVGVNTKEGKNMDGAFYHPIAVLSDTCLLETLPREEWKNGLAEIVKYAISNDYQLFDVLEQNSNPLNWSKGILANIIRTCCEIKKNIVEEDELEIKGLREVLNYGHTVGHAIEKVSGYRIPHGTAIGIGMVYEAEIAEKICILKKDKYARIIALLKKTELFVSYNGDKSKLIATMGKDKKNKEGEIRMALPVEPGYIIKDQKRRSISVNRKVIESILRKVN